MAETVKRVYKFGKDAQGNNVTEGNKDMKFVVGGKGANLAEMANIGLPVPPGFTITCQTCMEYANADNTWPEGALDARRCLNYWTIENRDEIPDDIARALDGRLFGCDLCQRVCPRNARVEATAPRELPLDAVERLDDATFRRLFKKTPVFRARVDGLQRVARALRERGEDEEGEN